MLFLKFYYLIRSRKERLFWRTISYYYTCKLYKFNVHGHVTCLSKKKNKTLISLSNCCVPTVVVDVEVPSTCHLHIPFLYKSLIHGTHEKPTVLEDFVYQNPFTLVPMSHTLMNTLRSTYLVDCLYSKFSFIKNVVVEFNFSAHHDGQIYIALKLHTTCQY